MQTKPSTITKKTSVIKAIKYLLFISVTLLVLSFQIIRDLLTQTVAVTFLAEFLAGMFYTSLFTMPLSIVLISLLTETNVYLIAAIGGLGALVGDFVLMRFFSQIGNVISIKSRKPGICQTVPLCFSQILGIACLILPFPDELAMGLLGITKISTHTFILIVYPAKTLGIFLLVLGIRQLAG